MSNVRVINKGWERGAAGRQPSYLPRVGAIADAHGSLRWCNAARELKDKCDYIVGLGDFINGGQNNLKVYETVRRMTEDRELIPLYGNHDLNFVLAMKGSYHDQAVWLKNRASNSFFDEVGAHTLGEALQNDRLRDMAKWFEDNLQFYHVDEYGALYTHAAVPIGINGISMINYGNRYGWDALVRQSSDAKAAIIRSDFDHDSLFKMAGHHSALLLNERFMYDIQYVRVFDVLNNFNSLITENVNMLVFGHFRNYEPAVIGDRIFGIETGIWGPMPAKTFLINTADQVTIMYQPLR